VVLKNIIFFIVSIVFFSILTAKDKPDSPFKPDKNTIVLYHFDGQSGNILSDSSGNGLHGKVNFAEWTDKGKFNGGMRFDGFMNAMIKDCKKLDIVNNITVEAWVWLKDDKSKYNKRFIVVKGNNKNKNLAPNFNVFNLQFGTKNNRLKVFIGKGDKRYFLESDKILEKKKFHHVGFSFSDGILKLIINGSVVKKLKTDIKTLEDKEFLYDNIYIGNNWSANGKLEGIIDEFRISNIVRY